jgi:type I restriction enzyme M protein
MRNLNAIVWLYRGETEKYNKLLNEYREKIISDCCELGVEFNKLSAILKGNDNKLCEIHRQIEDTLKCAEHINGLFPLNEILKGYTTELNAALKTFTEHGDRLEKEEAKKLVKSFDKAATTWDRFKKSLSAHLEEVVSQIKDCRTVIKEVKWLTGKFGEGKYADVPGLCKIASISEIEEKNWSLTPGSYVGVAPVKEDDENFEERMGEIHKDLLSLQTEANRLMDTISANFERLGL